MMWEAAAAKVRQQGGQVLMGHAVTQCALDAATRRWTVTTVAADGREHAFAADHVVSSMAVRDLVRGVQPEPPAAIRAAAEGLRYRDFLVVALIVRDRGLFDDNWIYIHEPGVKVGRIQNFKSWSPEMVPDPAANCLGMEYFCFEGDALWSMPDLDLIALARREIAQLGLVDAEDVLDGHVIRQPKAYPVYDQHHDKRLQTIRSEIEEAYPNLHLVGRNGMHRYNNQDHAMMTAMLTVENILAGRTLYNVWNVNEDAEYHEAGEAASRTMVPAPAVR
jgi:protoporphyrinogen oxidase